MARSVRYPNGVTLTHDANKQMWRVRWTEASGRRRSRWRKAKPEAERLAEDIAHELSFASASPAPAGPDLDRRWSDLSAYYLDPRTHDRPWSRGHTAKQEGIVRNWIDPALGRLPCAQVTADHCKGVLHDVRDAGLSDETVRAVGVVLRGTVNAGLRAGLLEHDPMAGVRYTPKASRSGQASHFVDPRLIPDRGSISALADAFEALTGVWWRGLQVMLAAYSGLRYGEQAHLSGRMIDLASCSIDVLQQYTWVGNERIEKLPKGEKTRTTIFPVSLAGSLARRIEEADGGLLFPSPTGLPHRHSNFYNQMWVRAAEEAGWPRDRDGKWLWTWHSLRHHFCTWALAAQPDGLGLEVADVTFFAGHHSEAFTWQAYVSRRDGAIDRALRASRAHRTHAESQAAALPR